jgi:hypothetical protein
LNASIQLKLQIWTDSLLYCCTTCKSEGEKKCNVGKQYPPFPVRYNRKSRFMKFETLSNIEYCFLDQYYTTDYQNQFYKIYVLKFYD